MPVGTVPMGHGMSNKDCFLKSDALWLASGLFLMEVNGLPSFLVRKPETGRGFAGNLFTQIAHPVNEKGNLCSDYRERKDTPSESKDEFNMTR